MKIAIYLFVTFKIDSNVKFVFIRTKKLMLQIV